MTKAMTQPGAPRPGLWVEADAVLWCDGFLGAVDGGSNESPLATSSGTDNRA